MNKTPTLTQKQRDAFEKTLQQALREAQTAYSKKRDEGHDIAIQTLAKEHGCESLVAEVNALTENLATATAALEEKGFELSGSTLRLKWNPPEALDQAYEDFIAIYTQAERDRRDEIQEALNCAWTISSLTEAKALIDTFATAQ
jgi:hypothetical protein